MQAKPTALQKTIQKTKAKIHETNRLASVARKQSKEQREKLQAAVNLFLEELHNAGVDTKDPELVKIFLADFLIQKAIGNEREEQPAQIMHEPDWGDNKNRDW
jgi:hypothetical protein